MDGIRQEKRAGGKQDGNDSVEAFSGVGFSSDTNSGKTDKEASRAYELVQRNGGHAQVGALEKQTENKRERISEIKLKNLKSKI